MCRGASYSNMAGPWFWSNCSASSRAAKQAMAAAAVASRRGRSGEAEAHSGKAALGLALVWRAGIMRIMGMGCSSWLPSAWVWAAAGVGQTKCVGKLGRQRRRRRRRREEEEESADAQSSARNTINGLGQPPGLVTTRTRRGRLASLLLCALLRYRLLLGAAGGHRGSDLSPMNYHRSVAGGSWWWWRHRAAAACGTWRQGRMKRIAAIAGLDVTYRLMEPCGASLHRSPSLITGTHGSPAPRPWPAAVVFNRRRLSVAPALVQVGQAACVVTLPQ